MGTFRENLKRERKKRKWSQAELSRQANIPLNSIQRWEQGDGEPRLSGLRALARAFQTSIDHLAGDEEKEEKK